MKNLINIFKGSILQNSGDEQSARVTDSGRKVMNFRTEKGKHNTGILWYTGIQEVSK